jgi:hypothetical protein
LPLNPKFKVMNVQHRVSLQMMKLLNPKIWMPQLL